MRGRTRERVNSKVYDHTQESCRLSRTARGRTSFVASKSAPASTRSFTASKCSSSKAIASAVQPFCECYRPIQRGNDKQLGKISHFTQDQLSTSFKKAALKVHSIHMYQGIQGEASVRAWTLLRVWGMVYCAQAFFNKNRYAPQLGAVSPIQLSLLVSWWCSMDMKTYHVLRLSVCACS